MMTCREIADFLMRYLDRELDEVQRREFEHHLELCKPCIHYLDSYRKTIALTRQAFADLPDQLSEQLSQQLPEQLPAQLPEALVQAILAARKPSS